MSYFIKNTKTILYKKRKQIIFALFAVICCMLDKNNSQNIIKAAAPAVVAGAAKAASGVSKGVDAVAKGASKVSAATANGAVKAGTKAKTANQGLKAKQSLDNAKTMNNINKFPKNTNPKLGAVTPPNNTLNSNAAKLGATSGISDSVSKDEKLSNSNTMDSDNQEKRTSNYLMPPFVPTKMPEEGETQESIDDAASQVVKSSSATLGLIAFGSLFLFVMLVPLLLLGVVNASSSTLSQIDCTKQQGTHCKVEGEEENFFSKLKNLFVYGAYGSNSEVILKKIEDAYDDIKREYDFIISLPLLTSSLFSDAEYIDTDTEGGNIVITDKMLERSIYILDMALLQLIPKYNVYTCNAQLVDSLYNIYEYTPSYEYSKIPTYEPDDTTELDMELIPTGECDASTAGGLYKQILYFFDENLYFKRLKISEELDLVYADFVDADKLLVSKVQTQYYLYKHLYNVDEELGYIDVPLELEHDSNINLQTPLKGWYSITSPFGNREGEFAGMHTGIDLVSSDKNIYAAGSGVVTRSNVETEGGNVIEITHTDKFGKQYVTQYAHLSERHVNVGDTINSGDVIGIMGDTGTMASGVHLHFSMWDKDTKDLYNPRKLFSNASNY